jgi:hypothetical protein
LSNRVVRNKKRAIQTGICGTEQGKSDTIALETAPRQGLAMHKTEIRCFKNGQWTEAMAPEWFGRATDTDEAWTDAFKKVTLVDEFDFGDSIKIYQAETGTYCVVFWDTFQALLVVFIEAASDYIQFRAQVIAPSVQLMLSTIQLDEWERTRRLSRAS